MQKLFSLDGKVALVTGASRGLGWAMARALAEAGAHVVLNGRFSETLGLRADELGSSGLKATTAAFDVTDEEEATKTIGNIANELGHLDILINNAGIVNRALLSDSTTEGWQGVLEVNLTSPFVLAREASKVMTRSGRIINIGSVLSMVGRGTIPSYVASKHGLAGLTRALAAELGPAGITVNAICPGYFRTEINTSLQQDQAFNRMVVERTPLGRWGTPDELRGAVVFLASEASSYVNGHLLVVDGGMTVTI